MQQRPENRRDSTGAVLGEGVLPVGVQRIETVQKTVEVPQLQLSWVSSSSWTRLLTCPLLCTSGVCRDSAENFGTSTVAVHRHGGGSDIDERLWRLGGVSRVFYCF